MPAATTSSTRERMLDAAQALVLERGFTATTVDAVLDATGASKGSFFHHFPTKTALGRALVQRYADADADTLERFMRAAEERSADPGDQLLDFVRAFEEASDELAHVQPGCLFVSFVYEQRLPDGADVAATIVAAIELWRARILDKLERAAATRPLAAPVDLPSLADQVFATFEGGFVLARATGDPTKLRSQLRHLRTYLTLLLGDRPTTAP